MTVRRGMCAVLELPELNVAVFGFLLSFAWEILQHPFFRGMAIRVCIATGVNPHESNDD
jgi:hypothetical protein